MPRKKTVPDELPELTETDDALETADTEAGAALYEQYGDDYVPPEQEEDFSLTGTGEQQEEEPDPVPELDVEHAPDFLSDALDVAVVRETVQTDHDEEPKTDNDIEDVVEASSEPKPTEPNVAEEEIVPYRPGLMAEGAERRAFFGLDFRELDRKLSAPERQEWSSIYASFRGHSVMTGKVAGINPTMFRIRDRRSGEITERVFYCAVVIPFRVPILIPETELWFRGEERPRNVTRNIGGANIDFLITKVEREKKFVMASRRLALVSRRYFFSTSQQLNRPGARSECSVLTVGNRQMLTTCHGYDITLTQRDLDYTAIPDLKKRYRRGETLECVVKEYSSRENRLKISVKEAIPNPYDEADFRHPVGCSRQGVIAGKYGGGVFCNLTDGVTVPCNYSFQYEDGDFLIGDSVTVVIQRFDYEKKQVFGKIVAKE